MRRFPGARILAMRVPMDLLCGIWSVSRTRQRAWRTAVEASSLARRKAEVCRRTVSKSVHCTADFQILISSAFICLFAIACLTPAVLLIAALVNGQRLASVYDGPNIAGEKGSSSANREVRSA